MRSFGFTLSQLLQMVLRLTATLSWQQGAFEHSGLKLACLSGLVGWFDCYMI